MIREEFFPTSVFGKDVQLDNAKLTQDIVNWSNQDRGLQKTNYKGWHSKTNMASKPEYQNLVNEMTLDEISLICNTSKSLVSRRLKMLISSRLVEKTKKDGKIIFKKKIIT